MALRKQQTAADKIIFPIEHLIDKSNKKGNIYFEIYDELHNLTMMCYSLNQELEELVKVTLAEKQLILDNNTTTTNNNKNEKIEDMIDGSSKSPNLFQDNKSSVKTFERKYTTTCIKLRNFLSNIF